MSTHSSAVRPDGIRSLIDDLEQQLHVCCDVFQALRAVRDIRNGDGSTAACNGIAMQMLRGEDLAALLDVLIARMEPAVTGAYDNIQKLTAEVRHVDQH